MATDIVKCIVTTHVHYKEIQSLVQENNLPQPPALYLDDGNVELVTRLETREVEPIFALYTGGPSSLIAGTGPVTGYYQVTSSVTPHHGHQGQDSLVLQDDEREESAQEVEERFKLEKTRNSFRLNYIKDMLDK